MRRGSWGCVALLIFACTAVVAADPVDAGSGAVLIELTHDKTVETRIFSIEGTGVLPPEDQRE